jgi:flagellar biosynthesis/type III secretory pathway M-ring protein FliF/YscJ
LQFVGFGNANVEVALDMTFTQGSKKITKYDAEGAVPNEEELISESTKNIATQPEGAAGVASNLQSRRRGSENIESKTENIKTKYMVPITEETQANSTPLRNFMSVSVMINSQAQGVLQEDGTMAPGMEEKITALVKNAVGFREDTDTISVQFMPFAENVLSVATPAPGFDWTKVTEIIEKASLAIAAMLAFFMGVLLLRKYRPVADKGNLAPDPQMDRTRMESVNELSKLIKDHPEVFTQIVRSWSGVDREQETGDRQAA